MLLVELLQRVANRFYAAIHVFRNASSDLRRATSCTRQTPSTLNDLALFLIGKLAEFLAAFDFRSVFGSESLNAAVEKSNPFTLAEFQSPTHEPLSTPTRDGFRRNFETRRQLFDRMNLLWYIFHRDFGRVRQVFNEEL
jgi:hypothetical protein